MIWFAAHDHGMESASELVGDLEVKQQRRSRQGEKRGLLLPFVWPAFLFSFLKEILVCKNGAAIPFGTERDIEYLGSVGVH